jgi:hypothetical protein
MSATVSLTQTQIFTAVVQTILTFGLQAAQPGAAVPIIRGQVNRVPEPDGQDFVVLWPTIRDPLTRDNIHAYEDTRVTASITANVMTVTAISNGPVLPGAALWSTTGAITAGCQIIRQVSGSAGGLGAYAVTPTVNFVSGPLYCGTVAALAETEVTIQADVHGPAGADNAARISTLWRDQFAFDAFYAQGVAVTPLYTSGPRQIPFDNGEQQVEERWVIDLCMQANIAVTVSQQFSDELSVTASPVESLA